MKHNFYKSAFLLTTFSLSGCMGIYEGGFECPPGEGTKCKSISAVNEMVNQGELPLGDPSSEEKNLKVTQEKTCCPIETEKSCIALEPVQIWWSPAMTSNLPGEEAF